MHCIGERKCASAVYLYDVLNQNKDLALSVAITHVTIISIFSTPEGMVLYAFKVSIQWDAGCGRLGLLP